MIEPTNPDLIPPAPVPAPGPGEPAPDFQFTVRLERVFHGPLDLLLQLVRDKELEIHLVSLAQVCDAYCQQLRALKQLDVDAAADFLVVAATLLAIKSRSLLPREELRPEDDPFAPGEELVQQLLVYKELRRAADLLGGAFQRRAALLGAGGRWLGRQERAEDEEEEEWDLGDVSIWDLLKLFRRLEEETGFSRPHHVRYLGRPLRHYVERVWQRLQAEEAVSLRRLLGEPGVYRDDAAYYLVALMELAKQQAVDLRQERSFEDVEIRRAGREVEPHLDQLDQEFDRPGEEPEVEDLLAAEGEFPSRDSPAGELE